ncbi:uncharacterized protein GGS25DRAFT_155134 [Hypoxylon fragiforme]|uniref:uncharacterized protein n=1 Tax=Hypoxylon fragiforme TaxID=63214 RepID=UPI0020C625E9|nr:uncharacterized protein GGS25DRAFT_155134 [Hypoxylon fragiforme]KAI2613221.1 hypothetical protein GGS25DRAFT_155134 [Hypoxylon fragiforme]
MHPCILSLFILQSLVVASPITSFTVSRRTVTELNQAAFEEAQQSDNTATKAFSGIRIRTSDGRCLFVDELSGDFRANLTPIQVAECESTSGQGWDIITAGKHNNADDSMLVASTLTNACFNFDPRRASGSQVILFSCGGRADGSGEVTDSQLFPFHGGRQPLQLTPANDLQSCFTVERDAVGIAPCTSGNADQLFTFDDNPGANRTASTGISAPTSQIGIQTTSAFISTATSPDRGQDPTTSALGVTSSPTATSTGEKPDPTQGTPVSRAGGVLQPSAVAEAHQRDDTATRAFTSVSIQAQNGESCAGTPNEKFDVITAGKHNNAENSALIVSSLTNGCISFDGRRPAGDTVTVFSCGGRAAGEGETNNGQLFPFNGGTSLTFAPESEGNATCIVPGNGRLTSAPCAVNDGAQLFTVLS